MSVLVTVVGPRGAADLELDDTRAVGELAGDVAAVLGEPAPAVLRTADGLQLPGSVTLAGAGVLDGDHLRLVPSAADARPSPDGEPPVLVCYLVLDTSDSMAGPALEAANAELARLWAAVRTDDRLADRCRLGVVTFDEEARLVAPLAAPSGLDRAPWFAATRPATNYEAAFRLLHRQLARDLAALRSAGRTPLRPLAVLVTDGRPTRGHWPPAHAALVDPAARDAADLVAFGFGDACEIALRRIGTAGAFLPAHAGGGLVARTRRRARRDHGVRPGGPRRDRRAARTDAWHSCSCPRPRLALLARRLRGARGERRCLGLSASARSLSRRGSGTSRETRTARARSASQRRPASAAARASTTAGASTPSVGTVTSATSWYASSRPSYTCSRSARLSTGRPPSPPTRASTSA